MSGVITASEPSWTAPFAELSPRQFSKLISALRREGAEPVRKGHARVEHAFARMKTWKILRDCRLKGDGVHHALLGAARPHHPTLAG